MSISRTSPPPWRQPRTLAILFWTGFGFAPFSALLLLVGSSDFTIKLALMAGLASVVLIGLSVALRTDANIVERNVYANMADVEAETRRSLNELRNEVRHITGHESAPKAVAAQPPRAALPQEEREDPRRPRPSPVSAAEYYGSRGDEREHFSPPRVDEREYFSPPRTDEREQFAPRMHDRDAGQYIPETTAIPRQRWDEDYSQPGYEPADSRDYRSVAHRGQAVEAWRADEPVTGSRRARGVEDGWSNEGYSGSISRSRSAEEAGRGRHYRDGDEKRGGRRYREDDELNMDAASRPDTGDVRRREYADSRSPGKGGSYMDTYYGNTRR